MSFRDIRLMRRKTYVSADFSVALLRKLSALDPDYRQALASGSCKGPQSRNTYLFRRGLAMAGSPFHPCAADCDGPKPGSLTGQLDKHTPPFCISGRLRRKPSVNWFPVSALPSRIFLEFGSHDAPAGVRRSELWHEESHGRRCNIAVFPRREFHA